MIDKNEHPEWNRYDETNGCVLQTPEWKNMYKGFEEIKNEFQTTIRDIKIEDILK